MKRTIVWAAATIIATVAVPTLCSRVARADDDPPAFSCSDDTRMKVGQSGRLYVWRPGGC